MWRDRLLVFDGQAPRLGCVVGPPLVVGLAVASVVVPATTAASGLLVPMLVCAFSVSQSYVMAAGGILTAEHADERSSSDVSTPPPNWARRSEGSSGHPPPRSTGR